MRNDGSDVFINQAGQHGLNPLGEKWIGKLQKQILARIIDCHQIIVFQSGCDLRTEMDFR